ncbi:hypothetical protein BDBG_17772 [Blastomyces gilchristii SLH14081]|uniref:Uncharacterized protein n=1 Tax=Blastomyces gilchristii (strain SLH14081) TaxID=559298 RepID=A0A179UYX6_BLAGS|nr:uncharacterized protein BDBG_17772 [Blastomyces gilchristii SLH14081]OAT13284.1 hypothetical protein BDBG_17772 [Blastomyces gilchristii SLH14081]
MIFRDTCELKRNFLKLQSLKATYQTTIYKSFCEFVFEINSQAQLCDMKDEEAVIYTMTDLYYTEVKNWLNVGLGVMDEYVEDI